MFRISTGQMGVLSETYEDRYIRRAMQHLREKIPYQLPASDEELYYSISSWIRDARILGLDDERRITKYIETCATYQGRKEPLQDRLSVYLQIYHNDWLQSIDVAAFVAMVMHTALIGSIVQEEGITWLAVLLLAGRQKPTVDDRWVLNIISNMHGQTEEEKLHAVHRGATERNWIAK